MSSLFIKHFFVIKKSCSCLVILTVILTDTIVYFILQLLSHCELNDVYDVSNFDKFKFIDFGSKVEACTELNEDRLGRRSTICRHCRRFTAFKQSVVNNGVYSSLNRKVKSLCTRSQNHGPLKAVLSVFFNSQNFYHFNL